MKTYAVDFESYYDKECSITVQGPRGYFAHPKFDAYMVSVVADDGYEFCGHPKDFDWSLLEGQRVLSHNAFFDETLYLYGADQGWYPLVNAAEWHCTADMTAYLGKPRALKNAIKDVFGIELSKATRDNMKGLDWATMDPAFKAEVTEYALDDSRWCLKLWQELEAQWPESERYYSAHTRKICRRGIPVNEDLISKHAETLRVQLWEAEQAIPWRDNGALLSPAQAKKACREAGVIPPKSWAMGDEECEAWLDQYANTFPWVYAVRSYRRINALLKKVEAFERGSCENRYYGGLLYCGAHTKRFSGSGGNLNLQNLPRGDMFGVNLRAQIEAPEGSSLVVVDLSQIEVRTLCWLAEDKGTLDEIRETEDMYEAFAIRFGLWKKELGSLKEHNPKLRQTVKGMVLGCFEPDTLVLTESGWKPILYLELDDKVWDGLEWVNHKGVICQGIQQTIRKHGIGATEDHEILTEHGWQKWNEVALNPTLMKSAIKSATLPYSNGSIKTRHGTLKCSVAADGLVSWTDTTLNQENLLGAITVLNKNLPKLTAKIVVMKSTSMSPMLENAYLIGYPHVSNDAITLTTLTITTTVDVGYLSLNRGELIGKNSSNILGILMDGITVSFNLTELTTIKGMSQVISGLLPDQKTCIIEEKLKFFSQESMNSKRKSKVYDVSYAGKRNRFTILTEAGPLIVHNCGYGASAKKYAMIMNCELKEAEQSVRLYQTKMNKVVEFWRKLDRQVRMATKSGEFRVELPSGNAMVYRGLTRSADSVTCVMIRNGRPMTVRPWFGMLVENASQSLARDIFCYQLRQIEEAGFKIILHVHDEVVIECLDVDAKATLAAVTKLMQTPPPWIPDIPLDAEGKIMKAYTK